MNQDMGSDNAKLYRLFLESFDYRDGDLYWKERPLSHFKTQNSMNIFNARFAGQKAGHISNNGYEMIAISGKRILTHRIIFFICNGFLPDLIDHIDGNRLNNRIENLRVCSLSQNQHNSKTPKHNTSGVKGGSFRKGRNKFQVHIKVHGERKYLGTFKTIEEATAVRIEAANKYHGEFVNHG